MNLLAKDEGLKSSEFIKLLVSQAWRERKGGEPVKVSEKPVERDIEPAVGQGEEIQEFSPEVKLVLKHPERWTIEQPGRKRHKSKKR